MFYVVFRFAIVKFDLKTPGREDDDVEAEKKAVLSNSNFTEVASIILEGLGGKGNVKSLDNCITRLRLEINDYTKVDEKKSRRQGCREEKVCRASREAESCTEAKQHGNRREDTVKQCINQIVSTLS